MWRIHGQGRGGYQGRGLGQGEGHVRFRGHSQGRIYGQDQGRGQGQEQGQGQFQEQGHSQGQGANAMTNAAILHGAKIGSYLCSAVKNICLVPILIIPITLIALMAGFICLLKLLIMTLTLITDVSIFIFRSGAEIFILSLEER